MTSNRWYSSDTQIGWTCKAFIEGRVISHKTEIREAHGWRLAAIVERLRNEFLWPIDTEYRGPDRVAYYRLSKGTDISQLKFPPSAARLRSIDIIDEGAVRGCA